MLLAQIITYFSICIIVKAFESIKRTIDKILVLRRKTGGLGKQKKKILGHSKKLAEVKGINSSVLLTECETLLVCEKVLHDTGQCFWKKLHEALSEKKNRHRECHCRFFCESNHVVSLVTWDSFLELSLVPENIRPLRRKPLMQ